MAITIQEKPYDITRLGQKLIIRATSTNVGNDGFKFVFRVQQAELTDYYVSPNPSGQGIFDLFDAVKDSVNVDVNEDVLKTGVLVNNQDFYNYPYFTYNVVIFEAWLVDGVITINEASETTPFFGGVIPASYNVSDGYKPNPQNSYGFENLTTSPNVSRSLMMGDRTSTTHLTREQLPLITVFSPANYITIPVRKSEKDWGVLNVITQTGDVFVSASQLWCKWTLIKSNLTSETYSEQLQDTGVTHIPAYPANLNEGSLGTVIPANFTDWKFYTIQLFNQDPSIVSGLEAMSSLYVFYPVEDDCIYDNVRLCWWSPVKGGFDFFNFTKVSQQSVEVERKRIKKIVGNYADASTGFTFNASDRGLAETSVTPTTTLEITSDWIQEGEYRLLANLVRSRYVWIISDEGNATPVVVDTNSFTERRERNGRLSRVTFRLRYSNENFYY